MNHSHAVSALAIALLYAALIANGSADDVHPLEGALLDPLGFVSPPSHQGADTLPPLFEAQRSAVLDIFSKSEMPSRVVEQAPFARAIADWQEFHPTPFSLREGSVLYGDPKILLASVQRNATKDPQSSGGSIVPGVICALGIIGALWIFVSIRDHFSSAKSYAR